MTRAQRRECARKKRQERGLAAPRVKWAVVSERDRQVAAMRRVGAFV